LSRREIGGSWVGRITGSTGKSIDDERVAEGSVVCAEQRVVQEGWSPSDAQMRGVISEDGGNSSSARASALEGRVSTVKWDPKGMRRSIGPQSMEATPKMNRSAKGGTRSSLHYRGEGVLIHPPYQGVCGRHDTEEQRVTSGELTQVRGWHCAKRAYKRYAKGRAMLRQ
jgi:hypothetical protein